MLVRTLAVKATADHNIRSACLLQDEALETARKYLGQILTCTC